MGRNEEGEREGKGERWRAMEEGGNRGREGGIEGEKQLIQKHFSHLPTK